MSSCVALLDDDVPLSANVFVTGLLVFLGALVRFLARKTVMPAYEKKMAQFKEDKMDWENSQTCKRCEHAWIPR